MWHIRKQRAPYAVGMTTFKLPIAIGEHKKTRQVQIVTWTCRNSITVGQLTRAVARWMWNMRPEDVYFELDGCELTNLDEKLLPLWQATALRSGRTQSLDIGFRPRPLFVLDVTQGVERRLCTLTPATTWDDLITLVAAATGQSTKTLVWKTDISQPYFAFANCRWPVLVFHQPFAPLISCVPSGTLPPTA
jgi:hypothetical protein